MVDENRLREWVEQKLDEGVDPERLKESLEDTGHDPSVVDEVRDPFQEDSVEPASEEHFEEGDSDLSSDIGASGLSPAEDAKSGGAGSDAEGEDDDPRFSLPSFSVPELPLWPVLVAGVLLLGVAAFVFVPWGSMGGVPGLPGLSVPSVDVTGSGVGAGAGAGSGECPDAGVRINSVYSRGGETVAEVLVTRNRVEVVLEVYRSGEKVGSTTDTFLGVSEMVVDVSGDLAVARAVGCFEFRDSEVI